MQLPFEPRSLRSVTTKVPLPLTLLLMASNSQLLVLSINTTWQSVTSDALLNFLITYTLLPLALPPYQVLSVLYISLFPTTPIMNSLPLLSVGHCTYFTKLNTIIE